MGMNLNPGNNGWFNMLSQPETKHQPIIGFTVKMSTQTSTLQRCFIMFIWVWDSCCNLPNNLDLFFKLSQHCIDLYAF